MMMMMIYIYIYKVMWSETLFLLQDQSQTNKIQIFTSNRGLLHFNALARGNPVRISP